MAAATVPRPPKFVPALNLPQIVAIAAIPGKMVPSMGGDAPSEVLFTLVDSRPWYVPQMIADQIYAMGIQARQPIEVTALGRKKTEVQIVPVQARIQPRAVERDHDYTPELTASLEARGPQPQWAGTVLSVPAHGPSNDSPVANGISPKQTATACMMASMCSAVDAIIEVQAYATRKGIGLTFSEESVRAIGLSIYIDACRNGGNR